MTFHSALTADAVWPADIRTALGLTSSPPQVYVGRRPRMVHSIAKEVQIERREVQPRSSGAFDRLRTHAYNLRVRVRALQGPDGSAVGQQTTLDADMRTLLERYCGLRPTLLAAVPGLIGIDCEEGTVDEVPEDAQVQTGVILVRFLVSE